MDGSVVLSEPGRGLRALSDITKADLSRGAAVTNVVPAGPQGPRVAIVENSIT